LKKWLLAGAVVVIFLVWAGVYVSSNSAPAYANDSSPVMYFYSEDCHFCQQQKPVLERLAADGFRVKLMDVKAHPDYWKAYSISGTPTFLAANGDRKEGLTQEAALRVFLESHGARIVQ